MPEAERAIPIDATGESGMIGFRAVVSVHHELFDLEVGNQVVESKTDQWLVPDRHQRFRQRLRERLQPGAQPRAENKCLTCG